MNMTKDIDKPKYINIFKPNNYHSDMCIIRFNNFKNTQNNF